MRERHDATNDITAPTVSAAEELADSNATIEGLLKQLGEVESQAEGESVEARRRHAAIRASLDHLHQSASMSEVSVRIVVTKASAGVTPGLAVLAPFALIALLIWVGNRFRVRRLRERTLG